MSEDQRSPYKYVGWVTGFGVTMVVCMLIGLYIGMYIDEKMNTSPWFAFSFLILGVLTGAWTVGKALMRELKKDKLI